MDDVIAEAIITAMLMFLSLSLLSLLPPAHHRWAVDAREAGEACLTLIQTAFERARKGYTTTLNCPIKISNGSIYTAGGVHTELPPDVLWAGAGEGADAVVVEPCGNLVCIYGA